MLKGKGAHISKYTIVDFNWWLLKNIKEWRSKNKAKKLHLKKFETHGSDITIGTFGVCSSNKPMTKQDLAFDSIDHRTEKS